MFIEQRHRWFLWWPVGMAMGILVYFQLSYEPSLLLSLVIPGSLLALFLGKTLFPSRLFFPSHPYAYFCLYAVFSIGCGFGVAKIRTFYVATPLLTKTLKDVRLLGTLREIEHSPTHPNNRRLILTDVSYPDLYSSEPLPTKVRLNAAVHKVTAQPGDRIECYATLLSLSAPVTLQGYDFQRHAYFLGIGAVGSLKPPCFIVNKASQTYLYQWRYQLTEHIRHHLPGHAGEIAAALITGDRSGISPNIRQNFIDAGIAHILAISGLHVSLVAGILFFLIRRGLALIPPLAERFVIKKTAAFLAILATAFYLAISGFGFPAQRAFMMITLVMVGILIDREPLSMRSLALSATVILCLYPESLLSISFQLSFTAVMALIAVYEEGVQPFKTWINKTPEKRGYRRLVAYGAGVVMTTVVATLATTPLIIYTFNRFTLQAVLGNLIAIPLISFWIMPMAVLSLLFLPLGHSSLLFFMWGRGIDILIQAASWIAHLPGAAILVPTPSPVFLILTVSGTLWLCLWQGRLRWWGIAPLALSLPLLFYENHPDIYVAGDGSVMAYRHQGSLYVTSEKRGKYYVNLWQRELGGIPVKPWPSDSVTLFNTIFLISRFGEDTDSILKNHSSVPSQSWIFSHQYLGKACTLQNNCFDKKILKLKNSYFVYGKGRPPKIIGINDPFGKRPWRLLK